VGIPSCVCGAKQETCLDKTNKREELEDKIKLQRERMQQAEATKYPALSIYILSTMGSHFLSAKLIREVETTIQRCWESRLTRLPVGVLTMRDPICRLQNAI